jgi:hypothetical protein
MVGVVGVVQLGSLLESRFMWLMIKVNNVV